MSRGGRFGWFLGLIFGTLFGFLFAPRKGKELRARIKADRSKGRLGIAPLQDDLKSIGHDIAKIAKNLYYSESVQDIVEKGRTKVKDLSSDFVGEISDFHVNRIQPLQKKGERTMKKAQREFSNFGKKIKTSAKVGRKAFREVKNILKKKTGE